MPEEPEQGGKTGQDRVGVEVKQALWDDVDEDYLDPLYEDDLEDIEDEDSGWVPA